METQSGDSQGLVEGNEWAEHFCSGAVLCGPGAFRFVFVCVALVPFLFHLSKPTARGHQE